MRYDNERATLLASPEELAGAAAALGLERGQLSTTLFDIGGPEEIRAFEDGLVRLDAAQRNIFESGLPLVSDPVRSAMVRTYSEGLAIRRFLGWDGDGNLATIEQLGDEIGLRLVDPAQAQAEMLAVLRCDVPFGGSDSRLLFDTHDLQVLVATADALRREWLESLLTHTPAGSALGAAEVAAAMALAATDDPRWTSSVLHAALPGELSPTIATVADSLLRLVDADVLESVDIGADGREVYSPTAEAAPTFAGIADASATAAITIYGMTPEGPGYETTLFARDAGTVWTLMFSPAESFLASASPSAVAALVDAAVGITAD